MRLPFPLLRGALAFALIAPVALAAQVAVRADSFRVGSSLLKVNRDRQGHLPFQSITYRVDTHLPWASDSVAVGDLRSPLAFTFKLIQPTDTKTTDPAIADVSEALRGLFAHPGYRLLDQSWLMVDVPASGTKKAPTTASTRLMGKGVSYSLRLYIDSVTATGVRVSVQLAQINAPITPSKTGETHPAREIFSTTVTITFNKTVVLGATHPYPSDDMKTDAAIPPTATQVEVARLKTLRQQQQQGEAERPLILVVTPTRQGN